VERLPASAAETRACCADADCPQRSAQTPLLDGWRRAAVQARILAWLSLAWMTAEALVGLIAGVGAGSVALIGWALGSAVEGAASVIVIWRFSGSRTLSTTSETVARKSVGISFLALGLSVGIASLYELLAHHLARPSAVGIALSASSVVLMPGLGLAKRRLGRTLGSAATAGEGTQNLLCAGQAAAVLLGLSLTATLGWSWVDPAAGLVVAAIAIALIEMVSPALRGGRLIGTVTAIVGLVILALAIALFALCTALASL